MRGGVIGVTWLNTNPLIASARFRSLIPREVLKRQGLVDDGHDVVIAAKHGWNVQFVRRKAKRLIVDVCDDHFSTESLGGHYQQMCQAADAITCNSAEMQRIIKAQTGRDAALIDDPYEDPERLPTTGEGVLWFGHKSNLHDLAMVSDQIHHPLTVISNHNWSALALDAALQACKAVVIPTGKSAAKSANRAIKAIRYGKYPVCGHLPAHAELGLGTRDLGELLDAAMEGDFSGRVIELQDAIRDRFSPDKVAKDWYRVIHETQSRVR